MHARSERVSAARHEQRPQVQERGLVKRLREQIRNLFFKFEFKFKFKFIQP